MSFNHPQMLWLGLTLPAILALYILRQRRRESRVPSTFFWQQATAELSANRPWRRLQPRLILWFQLLAAAAVTLAAAGPVWHYGGSPQETIVLLDASASMQATDVAPSRFQAACQLIEEEARNLKPGSAMTVIAFGRQPQVVIREAGNAAAMAQALAGLKPGAGGGDLAAALSLATALAREKGAARFFLVSDGGVTLPADAPPLEFRPVGREGGNVALAGLTLRPVAGGQAAQVAVKNHGSSPVSGQVHLTAGSESCGSRTFHLEPGGTAYLLWEQLPAGRPVRADLQVDDPAADFLALDNIALAVPVDSREARALLVTEGNIFLERVLALVPGLKVYRVTPDAYRQVRQAAYTYELTVLDGVSGVPLPPGAILWVNPPAGENLAGVAAGPEYQPGALEAVPGSPLMSYVDLAEVHLARAHGIKLAPGWRADMVAGDQPLLAHGESGGRRLALLAFDLHASDLPLRPAYPVLMQNVINWLLPPVLETPRVVTTGAEVKVSPLPLAERITVTGPDGRETLLAPPLPPAPFIPEMPGFYRMMQSWGGGGTQGERGPAGKADARTGTAPQEARQGMAATGAGRPGAPGSGSEVQVTALFAVNGYQAGEAAIAPHEPVVAGIEPRKTGAAPGKGETPAQGEATTEVEAPGTAPVKTAPARARNLRDLFTFLAIILALLEWRVACRGY
ncbi:MAG: hypothetical protein PWQ18_31 [Clostridia bacterium]|nr:hypothetical protein [Clostridia bacterium]